MANDNLVGDVHYARLARRVALAMASMLAFLLICEGVLRLAWANPYQLEPAAEPYSRLHRPRLNATVSAQGLYSCGGRVQFRTGEDRAISGGDEKVRTSAVALGGSTTESALVPEGSRWPDLVDGRARNYGVSGNISIDSYWNLRLLVVSPNAPITKVYLTHAVNDLRAFLSEGAEAFSIETWRQPPVDLFAFDEPGQAIAFGVTIRDSWLLSILRSTERGIRGRVIREAYLENRQSQAHLPILDDVSFRQFLRALRGQLLPARARVFRRIEEVAKPLGVEMVVCTQPHAYRSDYRPFRGDLRLFPVVGRHRLSSIQAAKVMDILNRQNISAAERLGWRVVDVASVFAIKDPSPLFYDSVHFTPAGSRLFAECVNHPP